MRGFLFLAVLMGGVGLCAPPCFCGVQEETTSRHKYRFVFYNVENLADTRDDSLTRDEEFTPLGEKHWTKRLYEQKLHSIFRVLSHLGEGELPAVVGVAEVENLQVLRDLVQHTPLSAGAYRIVHRDSPDSRGMDVAVLIRSSGPELLKVSMLPVSLPDSARTTRDILYLSLRAPSGDTLHLYVNHWPSRSEGVSVTEPFRMRAASVLRASVDSLFRLHPMAAVCIMGDFNDGPFAESVHGVLRVQPVTNPRTPDVTDCQTLYGLSAQFTSKGAGTYKYQGVWETIDHILVSGGMMQQGQGWRTTPALVGVFSPGYLLEPDQQFMGQKPFRTYLGPVFHGGYSDHLPVFADLFIR